MILSMTQDERNKLYVARCLLDGKMTISEAAETLGLSERQVKRIKKGVKEQGESFGKRDKGKKGQGEGQGDRYLVPHRRLISPQVVYPHMTIKLVQCDMALT